MFRYLMNGDTPVLGFDLDDGIIEVINNKMLPYELKDHVKTTDMGNYKKSVHDIGVLKDYLSSRTLNLSRENAKVILNVTALPQSLKTDDKLKIVIACKGLSMTDNVWIKDEDEDTVFSDVNLRKQHLSDASYDIAILGHHISATAEELRPDLSTTGMFPKYWHRENGTVYMYKTDNYKGNPNSLAEINASKMVKAAGGNVVDYIRVDKDGKTFSVSECISDDDKALISASSIRDWCEHTKIDFSEFIKGFGNDFANMIVIDYVIANTDRHFDNWGFLVNNNSNDIISFAPNFDFNQALIADYFKTNIDDLIYEPTGLTFIESIKEYVKEATINFDNVNMPEECVARWNQVKEIKKNIINSQKKSVSEKMEETWHDYFDLPKSERNGISWGGETLRPAIFEDKYLAQCEKEGKVPNEKISSHFWDKCVDSLGYEPKYCSHSDDTVR